MKSEITLIDKFIFTSEVLQTQIVKERMVTQKIKDELERVINNAQSTMNEKLNARKAQIEAVINSLSKEKQLFRKMQAIKDKELSLSLLNLKDNDTASVVAEINSEIDKMKRNLNPKRNKSTSTSSKKILLGLGGLIIGGLLW